MNFLRNRTVLGIICILLSLGICFGVTPFFNAAVSEKVTILRVKTNISTGEQITSEMLETVEVGGYNMPSNVIADQTLAVGSYALADFYVGDYILTSKISPTLQAENAYLYNLDGTKQAMSITIKSFATGLSGKIASGDIVSVISADYQGLGETIIPAELKFVEVISVTTNSGTDTNNGTVQKNEDDEVELPSTLTLLVTPEQSLVLAELEKDAETHVTLVYRGDKQTCDEFIAQQEEILAEIIAEKEESEDEDSGEKKDIVAEANDIINGTQSLDEILNDDEDSEVE